MRVTPMAGSPQVYARNLSAASSSSPPRDSAAVGAEDGAVRAPLLDVGTKNGIVSAVGAGLTQAVWASGLVPGGVLGGFVSGIATFALTKGVYHGVEEVRARSAKGMSTDGAFMAGFKYYGKANVLKGLLHTSIQSMAASLGGAGMVAGPLVSGVLTKLTGY